MTSSTAAALDLMRASLLLETDPAGAAASAGNILASHPAHEAAHLLLAAAHRRLGDTRAAVKVIEALAAAHPDSAVVQLELGRAFVNAGQNVAALSALQRAVTLDPRLADAWRELAAQCFFSGDSVQGDRAYLTFSRLAGDPPELVDALVALTENRLQAAEAACRRVSRSPTACRILATVAERRSEPFEAERHLNECLELAPGDCAAREQLARLLLAQERTGEAEPLIQRLRAADPGSWHYTVLEAQFLRLLGRSAEALHLLQPQLEQAPDADVWIMFGDLKREVGDQAGAIDAYRCAIDLRAGYGHAYWALANLKTFKFSDDDLAAMRLQLARSETPVASSDPAIALEFAMGAALEARGQYAESFAHLQRANASYRARIEYDPEVTTTYARESQELFTREFFAERKDWGSERNDPIFIVGLPRSGSTLLEQILASHAEVEGTRELFEVPLIAQELDALRKPGDDIDYPRRLGMLSREQIGALAERYLNRTDAHRPRGSGRFVDKMLGNFSHLGLIKLMFPRATIVDARRHPMACTFSCFKQRFSRGMNFSYEQRELGRYYRDYAGLLEHFDEVLPGQIYRLRYERLIADPETEVRLLLDHCGLPWDARCLRFYENRRVVQTISSEQVRQPLYADAVDQWRRFESWLEPLSEELAGLVAQYPAH